MNRVAVIIPVYNPGQLLETALQSVFAQELDSNTSLQVIVVNDASTEDLSWIAKGFPQVAMIHQSHAGVSVARNNGLLNAESDFIAFMDQDDIWHPMKLQWQLSALNNFPQAAVCYCDLQVFVGTPPVPTQRQITDDWMIDFDPSVQDGTDHSELHRSLIHFSSRFIVPSTVMFRKSALAYSGLLDPFIPFSGDYDLLIKLCSRSAAVRVPHVLTYYRKHDQNFSNQYEIGRAEVAALIARYTSFAKAKNDRALERDVPRLFRRPGHLFAAQAIDRMRLAVRRKDHKDAARHLINAMRFSPRFALLSVLRGGLGRVFRRDR